MNVSTDKLVLSGAEEEVYVSADEVIEIDGIQVVVKYFFEKYSHLLTRSGRVVAKLCVDVSNIGRFRAPIGEFRLIDQFGLKAVAIREWVGMRNGEEQFSASSAYLLRDAQRAQAREEAQASYREQLDALEKEFIRLRDLGRPKDTLEHLIYEAGSRIRSFNQGWKSGADSSGVTTTLRSIENEIARIADGGTELLVDDLMDGKIFHEDVARNQRVIDRVKEWSIRTGGDIEMLTPDSLREFYLKRAGSVTRVDRLRQINLALKLEDYVLPARDLEDMGCTLAPDSLEIQGRKNATTYRVVYDLFEVDGEPVSVGVIKVPLSVYERNAAEYGKKSGFPDLPHGIRLFIHVTVEGKEIAKGFDDDRLAKQVLKHKRSKNRGNAIDGVGIGELSYRRFSPIAATELPPWFKGSRPRW